jgi:ketosteroid isomerase-like protein
MLDGRQSRRCKLIGETIMSDANIAIVKDIYAAYVRGDVNGIMQHISDELEHFGIVSDRNLVPWHIQVAKKQDVPKFFQAVAQANDFTRFEPRDFAAGGAYVYCTISFDSTFRHNGKKLAVDNVMHRFKFKNGKVVEWRGSEDTAMIVAAYGAA